MGGFRSQSGKPPAFELGALMAQVHAAKNAALAGAALILVRQIKLKLSQPGTGKFRRKGKVVKGKAGRRGRYAYRSDLSKLTRASRPGEPPAVDTGVLRNSISYELQQGGKHVVGTNNEYAAPLEFGATFPNGGVLEPRPFMRPALKDVEKEMGALVKGVLNAAVNTGRV